MKEVINLEESLIEVIDATPIKTIDGQDYVLSIEEKSIVSKYEKAWREGRGKRIAAIIEKASKPDYGTAEEQLEYLCESGLTALVVRNTIIKNQFNKDGE